MSKLFLLRHLKSQWNKDNRFAGWVDVPLCKEGIKKAKDISKKISKLKIDKIYTSPLFRNQDTVAEILDYISDDYPVFIHIDKGKMKDWGKYKEIDKNYIPVYVSEGLNERYYGELQGQIRTVVKKKYGREKFIFWRRSFKGVPPKGESLADTYKRTIPFYKKYIEKDLKNRNNILLVGSHNALRSIIKYIEKISDKDIINVEIPYAGLIKYEFDKNLKLKNKENL